MVSELFSSRLLKLDKQFQNENRNVAMVLENCPANPNTQAALNAMKLPPNTTS